MTSTQTPDWLDGQDEDEAAEFAALGVQLDAPMSDAEIDAAASALLGALKDAIADAQRYAVAHSNEVARVDRRYETLIDRAQQRINYLENAVKALAERANFGKKQSRETANGVYGRRRVPERIKVVDKAALLDWAKQEWPTGVRYKTVEDVPHESVETYIARTNDVPPGVVVEEARVVTFARPD